MNHGGIVSIARLLVYNLSTLYAWICRAILMIYPPQKMDSHKKNAHIIEDVDASVIKDDYRMT
ncbi:hypothetical protein TP70_01230 [Staphylococcus microti]|uniref:Uncharacterized protein n=1 Tax=Staphylococcus microti TaxID=569857 RepID=A0ABR5CAZ5_9STAP|nr:hypothetical protein TP70_01230 [Staphylococcus microti]PNZ84334.1 hypothetical protein CD132_01020 [Staphylococcus microti]